ncbi:acyl-CoA thioesterase [Caminibacter sp.]
MTNVFIKEIIVKEEDIDFNGHVNNLRYLEWMINSAMEHSREEGFDEKYYKNLGATWVAKSHFIEYKKPAFICEKLILKTWIENIKHVFAIRKYQILKDEVVICEGKSEWVFVDMKSMRPKRIPKELSGKFISDK